MKSIIMRLIKKMIPVSIKRKIKTHINEFSYNRQTKTFSTSVKRRGIIQDGLTLLRSDHRAVVFAIEPSFNLDQIRNRSFRTITGMIATAELIFWTLPSKTSHPSLICLLSDERETFWKLLKSSSELKHWYVAPVDNRGRLLKGSKLVDDFHMPSDISAVRIFERVAYAENMSFRSGALQGVEIRFWIENHDVQTDKSIISCPVWHDFADTLPNPKKNFVEFQDSVAKLDNDNVSQVRSKIDIVYTWVDGSDFEWQGRKLEAENRSDEALQIAEAKVGARFRDNEELRYSLRSVYQYAPWVNKIYIVTDNQRPIWLQTDEKIEIVDHKDIWPDEDGLPSFNSHAIESCLHRIPGLSEHFLYFNDDVMLTRPIDPDLFFHPNGITKVFLSRAKIDSQDIHPNDNASSVAAKNARKVLTDRGMLSFSRKFFHAPGALRRSVCEKLESEFSNIYSATRKSQFRSGNDVAPAGSFYFNYGLSAGNCVPGTIKYDYIDPSTEDGRWRMQRLLSGRNFDCVVINDGAAVDVDYDEENSSDFIKTSLQKLLPVPGPWEKSI